MGVQRMDTLFPVGSKEEKCIKEGFEKEGPLLLELEALALLR